MGRDTGGNSGEPRTGAPRARRISRAGLADLRLWLGLALIVVSMVVGARLMSADDDSVLVMRATRDLSAGAPLAGLSPVRVSRATAGDNYVTDTSAAGVLRWPLRAGELVPRSALAAPTVERSRLVTVPVDPLHAPPGLQGGDLVDVWATARDIGSSDAGAPTPIGVLAGVSVTEVAADPVGGSWAVVLSVPEDQVGRVVAAARSSDIDLVAVPVDSQAVLAVESGPPVGVVAADPAP